MSTETTARWAATLLALAALVVLAVSLSWTASPVIASAVVLAVAGAVTVALWRRRLEALQLDRDRAATLARQAAVGPPGVQQQGKY